MHRFSDTIATIAAALAKAQVELTNPEKSLVATIRSPFTREADRTFRYAPLSSGLDIVRKSLGRHEIATIQATDIDLHSGLLRLTTVLAHSSGEWISSEWPVCQISDIASAQRVGAALTYARRYALFALVGIAGEDDLDAPDLGAEPNAAAVPPRRCNQSDRQAAAPQRAAPSDRKTPGPSGRSVLGLQLSASLREALIQQIATLNSPDEAAAWAYRNMPAKNALTAADAKIVEECFHATLSTMHEGGATDAACDRPGPADTPDDPAANDGPAAVGMPDGPVRVLNGQMPNEPPPAVAQQGAVSASAQHKASERGQERPRGGAMHAWGKTVRLRDKDHRKFVLRQPCLVCGRVPSDPHHLTFTQPRALGRRVSDEFMVPVCRVHHRELHRSGDETAWWRRLNIDPIPVALRLWQQSRADAEIAPRPQGRALKTSKVLAHGQARTSADARIESTRAAQNTTSNGASECGESSIGNRAPA